MSLYKVTNISISIFTSRSQSVCTKEWCVRTYSYMWSSLHTTVNLKILACFACMWHPRDIKVMFTTTSICSAINNFYTIPKLLWMRGLEKQIVNCFHKSLVNLNVNVYNFLFVSRILFPYHFFFLPFFSWIIGWCFRVLNTGSLVFVSVNVLFHITVFLLDIVFHDIKILFF